MSALLILKMNFNFNIKDSPAPQHPSIRHLTTAYDSDHTVGMTP